MLDVFFITKEPKDETTKICSKHFVVFRFRFTRRKRLRCAFVIDFF
jgi:hypothetical protein